MSKSTENACTSNMEAKAEIKEKGSFFTIPASCFDEDGDPVIDKLEGASPGDSVAKTESGLEIRD